MADKVRSADRKLPKYCLLCRNYIPDSIWVESHAMRICWIFSRIPRLQSLGVRQATPHSHLFQLSYMSVPLVGQQTFRPCGSNPFSVWSGGLRVTGRKTTHCNTGSIPVSGTWRVRSSRQSYILCLVQTPYWASHMYLNVSNFHFPENSRIQILHMPT